MSLLLLLDNPTSETGGLRPTVQEVALLERTRTIGDGNVEEDTFTSTTRPSAVEVGALIDQAAAAIFAQLPLNIDAQFNDRVRHLVTLYTAILIEGSYFREQLDEGSVALWRDLLTTGLASLRAEIIGLQGTGTFAISSVPVTTIPAQSSTLLLDWDLLA